MNLRDWRTQLGTLNYKPSIAGSTPPKSEGKGHPFLALIQTINSCLVSSLEALRTSITINYLTTTIGIGMSISHCLEDHRPKIRWYVTTSQMPVTSFSHEGKGLMKILTMRFNHREIKHRVLKTVLRRKLWKRQAKIGMRHRQDFQTVRRL